MSDGLNGDSGPSDTLVCKIFSCVDFVVVTGVNAGDAISTASDSFLGDTYSFANTATPQEITVGDIGNGFDLDSRLTFMGGDGAIVEVLLVKTSATAPQDAHDECECDYFLPLSPLVPDVEYSLIDCDEDPGEFSYSDYDCVCFTRGTLIMMADGAEKLIDHLREGDLVITKDHGAQPIRWIGARTVRAYGHLAPIVITSGALGNHSDLIVSQQHRIMLSDWRAEVMLGAQEVLVRARDLVNGETIYQREGGVVEYFHILFDRHEIIFAEGTPSESLHINDATLDSMAEDSRAEIIELFPEISTTPSVSAVASRMSLKSYEASALLKQVGFQ